MEDTSLDTPPSKPKASGLLLTVLGGIFVVLAGFAAGYFYLGFRHNQTLQEETSAETDERAGGSANSNGAGIINRSSKGNSNGPYYHSIYSASSADGLKWTLDGKKLFDHASVPGAVIKDGVIYLYFVDAGGDEDQLTVAISQDLGKTFKEHRVEITGQAASGDAVDPHPEVVDGKIRLYYLGNFYTLQQEEKKGGQAFKIYSAVSEDGINFADQQVAYADSMVTTDPDVFQTENGWRMFVSQEGEMLLMDSKDGVSFTKIDDFSWSRGGVSDTFKFDSVYRTYYCGDGIESATGGNRGLLKSESGARVVDGQNITCDPSVIELPDGTYKMYYKVQPMPTKK